MIVIHLIFAIIAYLLLVAYIYRYLKGVEDYNLVMKRMKNYKIYKDELFFVKLFNLYKKPLEVKLNKANINKKVTINVLLMMIAAMGVIGLMMGLILNNIAVSIMLVGVCVAVPHYWLKTRIIKNQNKITEMASLCIHVLITSFHFGVSISNLEVATEQMNSPIKENFERVKSQLLAGKQNEEIYEDFCGRVENKYLRFAVNNILVSLTQGTDLLPLLFNIMDSVQDEKLKIVKIQKASSEASFASIVSIGFAIALIFGYAILSPQFLVIYTTTFAGKFVTAMLIGVIIFVLYSFEKVKQIKI